MRFFDLTLKGSPQCLPRMAVNNSWEAEILDDFGTFLKIIFVNTENCSFFSRRSFFSPLVNESIINPSSMPTQTLPPQKQKRLPPPPHKKTKKQSNTSGLNPPKSCHPVAVSSTPQVSICWSPWPKLTKRRGRRSGMWSRPLRSMDRFDGSDFHGFPGFP